MKKINILLISVLLVTGCSLNPAGLYDWYNSNEKEPDLIQPTVYTTTPYDKDTNIPVTTNVHITFSEEMDEASTEISFSLIEGTEEIYGVFSWHGETMFFEPIDHLLSNAIYEIIVRTGARDTAGNNMASDFNSSFMTGVEPDWTPPSVDSISPADVSTDVPITTNISISFSEQMDTGSVQSAFTLSDGYSKVSGTFSWSGDTITFNPSDDLGYSTLYYMTVDTGARDTAGNNMASDFNSNFTTAEGLASSPIIADHTIANMVRLDEIPESAIVAAKASLHIAYDHTSHGAQLIGGMTNLPPFKEALGVTPGLYDFNDGGTGGALDLKDDFSDVGDLHSYPNWLYATREFLGWDCNIPGNYSTGTPNYNSNYNVVMWSWCYTIWNGEQVNDYLNAMDQLREDYPQVTFVYMTWRVAGYEEDSTPENWNDHIRQHCIDNDLVLYDFGDIERYDPDGNYYGDKRVNDDCSYDNEPPYDSGPLNGNWAIEWQNTHVQDIDWYNCNSPHSQPLNANMKAYAIWWLWARLAGWNGQPD